MTLAYDYPILGLFWTMLLIFLIFAFIMALFSVIADIFRSPDMGGFAKFLWILFIIVLPIIAVLIYMIARGDKMAEHAVDRAQKQQATFDSYVRQTAGGSGPADQIARLA